MAGLKLAMVLVVVMVASFQLQSTVAQTRHVVGDAFGWNVPSDGPTTYNTWASRQTFNVGDTLYFNFTTGFHDVTEVSQAAYGPCTTANSMSTVATGPATLTLRTPGNHYYVCSVGRHCSLGQKLTINVAASGSTTPTATSPAPTGTMPSSPTTPSPPSPSSASSFIAVVPVTFLAAAFAFFY